MKRFSALCTLLSSAVLHLARIALAGLGLVVLYGVICRYVFNNAPPYVEQVALILVISVAMFGAAAGARDGGHIGLDSLGRVLPPLLRTLTSAVVDLLTLVFTTILAVGSYDMGSSTLHDSIPTLGISEAWRYLPLMIASILIFLFAIEHLLGLALRTSKS